MIVFLLGLLCVIAAIAALTLEKAYFYVPLRELMRRATRGDAVSAALAASAQFDGELRVLLIGLAVLMAALGMVLFATSAPFFLGLVAVAMTLLLGMFWQPRNRLSAWEARLATRCSPYLIWIVRKLHPVLSTVHGQAQARYKPRTHTGIFEKEDIADLLTRQAYQRDSRVTDRELTRLRTVLSASDTVVRALMVPRTKLKPISAQEIVKPVLVDELHRTGYRYFPVYADEPDNIIGILPLRAISDVHASGTVQDNSDLHIAFVHQNDTLDDALQAFYETGQPAFAVVGTKGSIVGTLLAADLIERYLGQADHTPGTFDDREHVRQRHALDKQLAQNTTEVVE